MKAQSILLPAAFATLALAAPAVELAPRATATPTVYLIGDSTMAKGGGGTGTEGWGQYLQYSLSIPVVNKAIAGRSARSYTVEGHFAEVGKLLKAEDFVIIEFGHNDGGSLSPTDNGRTDCPGAGAETCTTSVQSNILTYPAYLTAATKNYTSLGARVILSSPTSDNPWETGKFVYAANRFTTYANASAQGFATAKFVDHGQTTANEFKLLGNTTVNSYYPNDHTHTSPKGADYVAQAFIRGVLCGASLLKTHVKNATSTVIGSC